MQTSVIATVSERKNVGSTPEAAISKLQCCLHLAYRGWFFSVLLKVIAAEMDATLQALL